MITTMLHILVTSHLPGAQKTSMMSDKSDSFPRVVCSYLEHQLLLLLARAPSQHMFFRYHILEREDISAFGDGRYSSSSRSLAICLHHLPLILIFGRDATWTCMTVLAPGGFLECCLVMHPPSVRAPRKASNGPPGSRRSLYNDFLKCQWRAGGTTR